MGSTSSSSSQIMITKHQFSVYLPIVEEKVTLKKINEFNQIINKYGIFLGVCPSRNQDRKRAGKNYLNEFASGQRDTKGIPDAIIVYQYALICTARIRIKDGRKEGGSRQVKINR